MWCGLTLQGGLNGTRSLWSLTCLAAPISSKVNGPSLEQTYLQHALSIFGTSPLCHPQDGSWVCPDMFLDAAEPFLQILYELRLSIAKHVSSSDPWQTMTLNWECSIMHISIWMCLGMCPALKWFLTLQVQYLEKHCRNCLESSDPFSILLSSGMLFCFDLPKRRMRRTHCVQ